MGSSKNPRHYSHVQAVLDAALAQGGGRYQCDSDKAAIRWRQEAYYFRKLSQKLMQDTILMPGIIAPTPYDEMFLTVEGATVVIQLRENAIKPGRLTSLKGVPLTLDKLTPQPTTEDEAYTKAAEKVKKDLLG